MPLPNDPVRYCEYRHCNSKNKPLPPFRTTYDRGARLYHKCCLPLVYGDEDWEINPLNTTYDQCIADRVGTTIRCKRRSYTDGFNTRLGYCSCHDYLQFHLKHG